MTIQRKTVYLLLAALIALISLPACSSGGQAGEMALEMAPMSMMPEQVHSAPVSVQEAYQFNYANPEVMKQIPCYCGCGAVGHTSNYDCYVSAVAPDGSISFESHALGCGICVDITRDVMRMLKEGKPVPEIRAAIDQTYSKYGPSNIPQASIGIQ